MATLLKVLNNLADIRSAGGVALHVRTQGSLFDCHCCPAKHHHAGSEARTNERARMTQLGWSRKQGMMGVREDRRIYAPFAVDLLEHENPVSGNALGLPAKKKWKRGRHDEPGAILCRQ